MAFTRIEFVEASSVFDPESGFAVEEARSDASQSRAQGPSGSAASGGAAIGYIGSEP